MRALVRPRDRTELEHLRPGAVLWYAKVIREYSAGLRFLMIELLAEAVQIAARQQQADARATIAAAIAVGGEAALAIGSAGGN